MKNWFWIPLAATVGVIAGSWGPREDLENYRESIQAERTQKKVFGTAGFDAFARLANIPDVAKRRPKARTNELARGVGHHAPVEGVTNSAVVAVEQKAIPEESKNKPRLSREDLAVRIEEAAELWKARVEIAKTQWKGRLGIKGEQSSAAFDSAIATMNETLRDTMEAFAEEIENAGKMTPELGLRMMGDLTRNLAEAYDAIGATVAPERRVEASEVPVHEFIDPMVAEPLIGVQDKLEGGFLMREGIR